MSAPSAVRNARTAFTPTPQQVFVDGISTWPTAGGPLHSFRVDIHAAGMDSPIGAASGWISWHLSPEELSSAALLVGAYSSMFGAAVERISAEGFGRDVVFVERIVLDVDFRGYRLNGAILMDLVDLLCPHSTDPLVVLQPEPLGPGGLGYDRGAFRDRALERLRTTYRASGLLPAPGHPEVYLAGRSELQAHA